MMFCLLLVIIDQVDVVCVTFFKAESDPPVSGNRDTPKPFQIAFQRVKPIPR